MPASEPGVADPAGVLDTLLRQRHSCRAFLPRPVPRATIERIVEGAGRAASWCNTQPWQLAVAGPAATDRFRTALMAHAAAAAGAGAGAREIAPDPVYRSVHLDRRRESGRLLYASVGVERGDQRGYAEQSARNYALFDAPNVAILSCDRELGPYGLIDCGAFIATLMLIASSLGVASIALASTASYPEVVREHFAIADSHVIVSAIALGFTQADHPANGFRTSRVATDQVVTWFD